MTTLGPGYPTSSLPVYGGPYGAPPLQPYTPPPQAPARVEVSEKARIKVARLEPREARGMYGSFSVAQADEVEQLTVEKWGRGIYEFQIWDGLSEVSKWRNELAGKPAIDAEGRVIPIPEAPAEANGNGQPRHVEMPNPYGAPGMFSVPMHTSPDGLMRTAMMGGSPETFWHEALRARDQRIAALERQLDAAQEATRRATQEASEASKRTESEKTELIAKVARLEMSIANAEERAKSAKYLAELEAKADAAKAGGAGGLTQDLIQKLLDRAMAPPPPVPSLKDRLEEVKLMREAFDGGGDDDDDDGDAVVGGGVLRDLADLARATGIIPKPEAEKAPAQQDEIPQDQQQAEPEKEPAAAFALPSFKGILESGLTHLPDDVTRWGASAIKHLTPQGREGIKAIGADGTGLADWAGRCPGITVEALKNSLKDDLPKQIWIMRAIKELQQRAA